MTTGMTAIPIKVFLISDDNQPPRNLITAMMAALTAARAVSPPICPPANGVALVISSLVTGNGSTSLLNMRH